MKSFNHPNIEQKIGLKNDDAHGTYSTNNLTLQHLRQVFVITIKHTYL